jgi:8-oxo-dGTP pyrophosphatase MutT (NUDIX family)
LRSISPTAEKATALITRAAPHGRDLLLFEHPYGSIQLPAGTVEVGEPHALAAAREAAEETGLSDLPPGELLAAVAEELPPERFLTLVTTPVYARPDPTSMDWARIRYGIAVQRHRTDGEYTHVTFTDTYHRSDPPYVSYQITGWVPTSVLTRNVTRYFYHFPYHGRTPATWYAETDNHRFRLFWAPLDQLPAIVEPQRWWVTMLATNG